MSGENRATHRPEFIEAVTLVARAIDVAIDRGAERPVLVGGAAAELFTGSEIASGDFDFVAPYQQELIDALAEVGFVRILEPGYSSNSLIHRRLGFGLQIVSGHLMDGKADSSRVRVFLFDGKPLAVIPPEDLIADRLSQAFAVSPMRKDMLDQAIKIYLLAGLLDRAYLDRRIRDETSNSADLNWLMSRLP